MDAPPPFPALESPPRRAPGHPFTLFVTLLVLYIGPGSVAQLAAPAPGLAWTQLFAFLLPAAVLAAASNLVPARALLLDRPAPRGTVPLAFAIGAGGFVVASALMGLVASALPRSLVKLFDLAPLFQEGARAERLALAVVAAGIAPFCEEAAFRGHLLGILRARFSPGAAVAVTALAFAILHLDPVRFLAVLLLGLVFGWLALRSGSLWPSVAAHATNNAIGTLLVAAAPSSAATVEETPGTLGTLLVLATGVALLAPLLHLYRRLTPEPPPPQVALAPSDPADPDPRLRLARVPSWMRWAALSGAVVLAALVLAAKLVGPMGRAPRGHPGPAPGVPPPAQVVP